MKQLTEYIHPLFFHLSFFIIGIILASAFIIHIYILLTSIGLNIVALIFFKKIRIFFFISLCLLLGALCYQLHIKSFEHFYNEHLNKSYSIVGVVTDYTERPTQPKWIYTIKCELLIENQSMQNISCKANFLIYSSMRLAILPGDTIRLQNVQFKKPKNEAFCIYLYKSNMHATIFLNNKHQIEILDRPAFSIFRFIYNQKQRIYNKIKTQLNSRTLTLFSSLFLGGKQGRVTCIELNKKQFQYWGISHYLARSGLHVMIFIMLWGFLLRFIPMPIKLRHTILLITLLIYSILTTSSISFVRALLMFIVYTVYIFCEWSPSMLHILMLITTGLLLYNPFILFGLDFQLSFGITFALLWYNHINLIHNRRNSFIKLNT